MATMTDIPDIPIPDGSEEAGSGHPSGRAPAPGIAFPWRLVAALVLFGLIVLFALQNTESVDVNFLFWDFGIPLIVVIVATMAVSVVFGDMIDWWWRRRKKKHQAEG